MGNITPPPPSHTNEKATDLRKRDTKNVTLNIKDGLTQMHIADDDDASALESVGSSEFEDTAST